MKTISIKQPWASLICSGIKDIENRTWATNVRGRVLVHASAAKAQFNFTTKQNRRLNELNLRRWYDKEQLKSAIIGSVEIVDCVINNESIWAEKTIGYKKGVDMKLMKRIYGTPTIYNWVLANPVLFAEPILNVKGKLSFWDYPMNEDEYLNLAKIGNPLL